MPSLESNVEDAIIAVLNASPDLASFQAVAKDTNEAPANSKKDRLVVNCAPREVELYTPDRNRVACYRLPVTVEVYYVSRDVSTYDANIAAVEAALGAATPPAAAVAAWVAAFPYGGRLEQMNDGSDDTGGNTRQRQRTFQVFAMTGLT